MARGLLVLHRANGPRTLRFGLLLFAGLVAAQERPIEAWWLRVMFPARETAYDSLRAWDIDPTWVKISMLSYESLPSEAQADLGWMRHGGFAFRIDNYFKRANLADRELCGVFEDRSGHKGRFLLVLEKPKDGPWKVAFVHREVSEAGFSVLIRKPQGLFWGTCMQCDDFSRLHRSQGRFSFDPAP